MSTAIESYGALHYSPFVLAALFEAFYQKTPTQPNNLLLAYIVLPLVLHGESRSFLKNANERSSLATFCRDPARLYGLPERVQEFRELTHACLQLALDAGGIRIEDDLSVTFLRNRLNHSFPPRDAVRAARNLRKVLGELDVPAVYRLLGVKRL